MQNSCQMIAAVEVTPAERAKRLINSRSNMAVANEIEIDIEPGAPLRLHSNRERPFHLGPLALERLRRTTVPAGATGEVPRDEHLPCEDAVLHVIPEYISLFSRYLAAAPAAAEAPVSPDPSIRANNLKAHAYFLDAVLVGCCQIQPGDWRTVDPPGHHYACVFAVEFGREPRSGEPGDRWIRGCNVARTDLRCAELAVVLSDDDSRRSRAPSS
jgi:hypothetical protein